MTEKRHDNFPVYNYKFYRTIQLTSNFSIIRTVTLITQ